MPTRVSGHVAPGRSHTDQPGMAEDPERRERGGGAYPNRPRGPGGEIAAVFAFLASDDAAYITGQTIYVDGGPTLCSDFRAVVSGI